MKRSILILTLGIVAAALAYAGVYRHTTAPERAMIQGKSPELLWLRQEFKMDDAQFARVCELHAAYLPQCRQMCARIAAKNAQVRATIAKTQTIPADLEKEMSDIAQLRAECQKNMLRHFAAVSRSLPPEEGRRYLQWVLDRTLPCPPAAAHAAASAEHEGQCY